MQAQARRQEHVLVQDQQAITETASLTAVKTLITAGFGCLTYLRFDDSVFMPLPAFVLNEIQYLPCVILLNSGLLPDDNFDDARLSSLSIAANNDQTTFSQQTEKALSGVRLKCEPG
jgi:hypothetical protein